MLMMMAVHRCEADCRNQAVAAVVQEEVAQLLAVVVPRVLVVLHPPQVVTVMLAIRGRKKNRVHRGR